MASVRMTNELRDDIRRAAERAYSLSNPEPKPSNEYVTAVRAAIICSPEQTFLRDVKILGKERGVDKMNRYGINILPQTPKEAITGVELRVKNAGGDHSQRDAHRNYRETTVKFDTPMTDYLIFDNSNHRWGDPVTWVDDMRIEDKTLLMEHFHAFLELNETWATARRTYEHSIRELVSECTTLKQLLEIWPAAESLVPANKIQKMHTKVTRAQRAAAIKEEICFDPTIANQAVLTAKMLGG